jgi:hypothetical protein
MRGEFEYRCEAETLEGFIQQLAVSYLRHGYFFYVTGTIREGKDPRDIDRRIVERYGLAISKFTRARRKKSGAASVQYLRHERFFVLMATHGKHRFYEEEVEIKDARETPIRYEGYSVSVKAGHSCVRIDRGTYLNLKAYFEEIAAKRSVETLSKQLRGLPFSPFAPVRSQYFAILRAVNRARQVAGFEAVPRAAIRVRRAPVKTFETHGSK